MTDKKQLLANISERTHREHLKRDMFKSSLAENSHKKIFLIKCKREEIINRSTINYIELTPELEEKIIKEVFKKMYEVYKWAWVPAEWHNNIKPMFMESGVEVAIHEAFQKLKEEVE